MGLQRDTHVWLTGGPTGDVEVAIVTSGGVLVAAGTLRADAAWLQHATAADSTLCWLTCDESEPGAPPVICIMAEPDEH